MEEARLLSVTHSNKTRSNCLKLEHSKLRTNMWKNFLTVRVTEHWSRLPREVAESPSREIFKTYLDIFICVTSGGLNDLLRSLPTPAIL